MSNSITDHSLADARNIKGMGRFGSLHTAPDQDAPDSQRLCKTGKIGTSQREPGLNFTKFMLC